MKNEQEESNSKDYPFNIKKEDVPELNNVFKANEYPGKLLKITSVKDEYFKYFVFGREQLTNEKLPATGEIKTITINNEKDNSRGTT